jgi:hypothetical protein
MGKTVEEVLEERSILDDALHKVPGVNIVDAFSITYTVKMFLSVSGIRKCMVNV